MKHGILNRINTPQDVKGLSREELTLLAEDLREFIIEVVSKNGGHLASNLGTIELTLALHYVFDSPKDKLVWDVGHQCYAHKIITGRKDRFPTIRRYGGLSGFPKREESEHDVFNTGHASTSISAALGMAEALNHLENDGKVVAIIGDGSMTAGIALEALNQAGHCKKDLIVVLNDNEMSISPNVGALSRFMSMKMTGDLVLKIKREIKQSMKSIPKVGENIYQMARKVDALIRRFLSPGILFEAFGFSYIGPVQGHNIDRLIDTFKEVKNLEGPVLVHVLTKKGKGYKPAEEKPSTFHGISPFNIESGEKIKPEGEEPPTYTQVFADTLCHLAKDNKKIVAITAAMPDGTGLSLFAEKFPDRFYDVGIAEQHAVTFACGLATQGMKPVVAIYSTFLQRAFDQVVHDAALMNLPVVFAMDRAGLVGDDGPTHHGAFDISFLRSIPNLVIMSPKNESELQAMLKTAIEMDGPVAIRYPRGKGEGVPLYSRPRSIPVGKAEVVFNGGGKKHASIIAVGTCVEAAVKAAAILKKKRIHCRVINARFIKPLDVECILDEAARTGRILTVEENALMGGFGSAVLECLAEHNIHIPVRRIGLPDEFVEHGSQKLLRSLYGLDENGIASAVEGLVADFPMSDSSRERAKAKLTLQSRVRNKVSLH